MSYSAIANRIGVADWHCYLTDLDSKFENYKLYLATISD